MKLSKKNMSRIQEKVIPELKKRCQSTGKPASLNELPIWRTLGKSDKIKIGRYFKKLVQAGEVEGFKFAGVTNDNHSTYNQSGGGGSGGGISGFFRRLFG